MYNLEIEKAERKIIDSKAKVVCIQLPDGLKPRSKEIVDHLHETTAARILIWAGSCFGACDTPNLQNVDLLIQWGHNEYS